MQWMLSLWYITHINPNLNALVDHELITSLCKRSREVTIPVNICLKITSWLEVLNNQMEKQYADLLPVGPGSTLQGRSCSLVSEWVKVSLRKAQNKCTPFTISMLISFILPKRFYAQTLKEQVGEGQFLF